MLTRVLLAIEDEVLMGRLRSLLSDLQADVRGVRMTRGFWSRLTRESADMIIVSRDGIPAPLVDSVRLLRQSPEEPALVVIAEESDHESRTRLLAAGCEAVLPPQVDDELLGEVLATLLERRTAHVSERLNARTPLGAPRLSDFVSSSPAMQAFMEVVEQVSGTDASLLVLGETGVGKERLARAIHAEGRRSGGPFIPVNCGALPEGLIESELFGHVEGAFTGATRTRRGWFELAHGGTLFLDEIGEMPLHLQVKLLRALQEHEFQAVGSERTIRVDVRIMAASNRNLEAAAEDGSFRRDLFYRLSVITLTLPCLRERTEDIPDLAESYVEQFADTFGRPVEGIAPAAMESLVAYAWPGNVRELINVIERAVLLCRGLTIEPEDLPSAIGGRATASPATPGAPAALSFDPLSEAWERRSWQEVRNEALARVERAYLHALLDCVGGRIGVAAARAGLSPRSLYDKMKAHGLRKEEYRG